MKWLYFLNWFVLEARADKNLVHFLGRHKNSPLTLTDLSILTYAWDLTKRLIFTEMLAAKMNWVSRAAGSIQKLTISLVFTVTRFSSCSCFLATLGDWVAQIGQRVRCCKFLPSVRYISSEKPENYEKIQTWNFSQYFNTFSFTLSVRFCPKSQILQSAISPIQLSWKNRKLRKLW